MAPKSPRSPASAPSSKPDGAAKRPHDLVVWGASGFVGRLVTLYLAGLQARGTLKRRWAIAGRSPGKLEALQAELAERWPQLQLPPILVAESLDPDSIAQLAASTHVVLATVGPYALYGSQLVAACITQGTDYCDLTGELHWIRQMIDAHHELAQERGVRIVHGCGFDSIPSDLGVLMLQDEAQRRHKAPAHTVRYYLCKARGGFSGGTVASMAELLKQARRDIHVRSLLRNPYALNPAAPHGGRDTLPQQGLRYDERLAGWTAPFIMAAVNEPIVRRSNALLGFPWGRSFRYSESAWVGDGVGGALKGAAMVAGLAGFASAMLFGPSRSLLQRFVLPAPGEGPSAQTMARGYFKVLLTGQGAAADGTPFALEALIEDHRDPGYGSTAVMIAETGLALRESRTVPNGRKTRDGFGVLTTASAHGLGMALVERLRGAGMAWEVHEAGQAPAKAAPHSPTAREESSAGLASI